MVHLGFLLVHVYPHDVRLADFPFQAEGIARPVDDAVSLPGHDPLQRRIYQQHRLVRRRALPYITAVIGQDRFHNHRIAGRIDTSGSVQLPNRLDGLVIDPRLYHGFAFSFDDLRVELNTFPSTKVEALALLYVQSQDLSGLSPEDVLDMYQDAYTKIRERSKENNKTKSTSWML